MKLQSLGSSSKGNCYVLTTDENSVLVIECGVPFMEVKKAIGFDIAKIQGVLLTHSHGDHNKYVSEYLKAGIKVYAHPDTIKETRVISHNWKPLSTESTMPLAGFQIMPFLLKHDVTCLGFLFRYKDGNTFPFITDTHYCPFVFPGMTNIIVECNYSLDIISKRSIPKVVHDRVLRSHMSLDTVIGFLKANDLRSVNNIVLIHLSDGNSHAENFKKEIEQLTGKTVHIADKGTQIEFNKHQF